jgi:uncharacterized protein YjbJ (UPF0337 family)
MNKNQIEGRLKAVAGKVRQKIGQVTGNRKLQVKGVANQIEGHVEKGVGDVEQALDKAGRKAR